MFEKEMMSLSSPVLVVPAQEPTSEGGWFKSLFDLKDGGIRVSVCRVALNVADSWTQNTQLASGCTVTTLTPHHLPVSPVDNASVFSSSRASRPIQTKTCRTTQNVRSQRTGKWEHVTMVTAGDSPGPRYPRS